MRYLRIAAILGICVFGASYAHAQVAVGIGYGPGYYGGYGGYFGGSPDFAYGYYGYYPYDCAPYGFYGSDWFVNGIFIGAGPWYGWGWGWGRGWYGRGWGW